MKNKQSLFALFGALAMAMTSCSDVMEQVIQEELSEKVVKGVPFHLNASIQDPATRVKLGEDNMTMLWEPGDKLVLKNMETGDVINMVSDLQEGDEPTTSCSFTAEAGVPEGNYYVMVNGNPDDLTFTSHELQTPEEIRVNKLIGMYSTLEVKAGQTSANIQLKHAYAKIRINLQNTGNRNDNDNYSIYMKSNSENFVSVGKIKNDGTLQFDENSSACFEHLLLDRVNIDLSSFNQKYGEYYALISPSNLTGSKVYFYVTQSNYQIIYEIEKDGINIEAGKSYKINLDLSKATKIECYDSGRGGYLVKTPQELRAASIIEGNIFIDNDIDMKNEVFFPLGSQFIQGNQHTISNISINSKCSNIAFCINSEVNNLILNTISVKGLNRVASFHTTKYSYQTSGIVKNCKLIGENVITGNDFVGGISTRSACFGCIVDGNTIIKGHDYVGGINPYSSHTEDCSVGENCVISGNNYVGGIVGEMQVYDGLLSGLSSYAKIEAEGDCVGGVIGHMTVGKIELNKCHNYGIVSGNNNVGGIIGSCDNSETMMRVCSNNADINGNKNVAGLIGYCAQGSRQIETSCNIGNIYAVEQNAGGLVGCIWGGSDITDCYSLGNISSDSYAAGIIGCPNNDTHNIYNCYVADKTSNNDFMGFTNNSYALIYLSNCVTTLPNYSNEVSEYITVSNCYKNVEYIVDYLSVINANGSYSSDKSNIWPIAQFPAKCPVFSWQVDPITGNVNLPGFSEEQEW